MAGSSLIPGHMDIAGYECIPYLFCGAPAPEAWSVWHWDKYAQDFINVCPEPQPTREAAIAVTQAVLTNPNRYVLCTLATARGLADKARAEIAEAREEKMRVQQVFKQRSETRLADGHIS